MGQSLICEHLNVHVGTYVEETEGEVKRFNIYKHIIINKMNNNTTHGSDMQNQTRTTRLQLIKLIMTGNAISI